MKTTNNKTGQKDNDDSDINKDEIGENTGDDTILARQVKSKESETGKPSQASSNKGQGPSGENL